MASAPTPKRKAVCSNHIGDASVKTKPGRSMNPPGLVFSIESESANAALTPALPRRGAGFLRQGSAVFGAGRQGHRRYSTTRQPALPVPVAKEPRVLCPAGDASSAAARAAPPPPIRLPTSKYPMKPFRNRLPHLWECLAWEPSSSGVPGTGERYTFQSGRRRPEKRLFSFFRSEKARFGMA